MTEIALGLDGGGTKTLALVSDLGGATLGQGAAGACNIAFMPFADAMANALAAAQIALDLAGTRADDVRAVCAGVAGWSFAERRTEFHGALRRHFPRAVVAVEPDYAVALTGALDGAPGIVVVAGTGSVAYGENGAGHGHKTGAYGYLIDDAGSGYGVGREALAAVLRAADGTGEQTSLTARVFAELEISDPSAIVPGVYGGAIDRVRIASLSRIVADAAREDNDALARAILMRSGGALARLAEGAQKNLFTPSDAFAVAQIGGLWNAGPSLTDVFARSLARFAPRATLTAPAHPPVEGAVRRAVRIRE